MSRLIAQKLSSCFREAETEQKEERGATIVNRTTGEVVCSGDPALPPKLVPLEKEVPPIVQQFITLIKEQELAVHHKIGFVVFDTVVKISESDMRRGTLAFERDMNVTVGGELRHRIMIDCAQTQRQRPHALSVVLSAFDMSQMPFDCQLMLRGFELAQEKRLGQRKKSDALLRDCVLVANKAQSRGMFEPDALLTRPLVCRDPVTGITFGSVEAIGFSSRDLFRNVVVLINERTDARRARQLARLFGQEEHSGFYLLPRDYQYTSLLTRVYAYLKLRQLRAQGDGDFDRCEYELPFASDTIVMPARDMENVVEFIDSKLVDVHPVFDPTAVSMSLSPFGYASWTEAWNDRVGESRAAVRGFKEREFQCKATLLAFYAFFEPRSPACSDNEESASSSSSHSSFSLYPEEDSVIAVPEQMNTVSTVTTSSSESSGGGSYDN